MGQARTCRAGAIHPQVSELLPHWTHRGICSALALGDSQTVMGYLNPRHWPAWAKGGQ